MLFAALVAASSVATESAMATELEQTVCSNGTRNAPCSVKLDDDSLELRLDPNLLLQHGGWGVGGSAAKTESQPTAAMPESTSGARWSTGFFASAQPQEPA